MDTRGGHGYEGGHWSWIQGVVKDTGSGHGCEGWSWIRVGTAPVIRSSPFDVGALLNACIIIIIIIIMGIMDTGSCS